MRPRHLHALRAVVAVQSGIAVWRVGRLAFEVVSHGDSDPMRAAVAYSGVAPAIAIALTLLFSYWMIGAGLGRPLTVLSEVGLAFAVTRSLRPLGFAAWLSRLSIGDLVLSVALVPVALVLVFLPDYRRPRWSRGRATARGPDG